MAGDLLQDPRVQEALQRIPYIAGLFDGEGCVYISKIKVPRNLPCYSLYVAISMTDSGPVQVVNDLFPARLYVETRETKSGRKVTSWHAGGQAAVLFLKTIEPYVVGKKEQVQLALEYASKFAQTANNSRRRTPEEKQEQESYFQKLHNLKGVDHGKLL